MNNFANNLMDGNITTNNSTTEKWVANVPITKCNESQSSVNDDTQERPPLAGYGYIGSAVGGVGGYLIAKHNDNTTSAKVFGSIIGGSFGYVIGFLIDDYLH